MSPHGKKDEDRARLNRYTDKDMQFKDLIGVDFRYENKFNVNIGKQGKIASEKSLKKISKYENVEKKALAAKRKGKSHKEVEKIYKEGVKKIKEDELYEKDKVMSSEEKAFYEHVMKNGNVFTYKMKVITSEGKYYLVNERIINEEADSRGAVSDRELPPVKITLEEFRKDVLNGQVVYVPGLFVTGYGIRKIDAQANKDIKNDMLLNGLIQTGTGIVKSKVGGTSVALGGMLCYGGACFIGAQMMGSGLGVGGMGLNETYVGVQNVAYSLSTDSGLKKGKAVEEFTRVQKHNDSLTSNAIKIRNPILDYIVNHGGTEADYNHINAMTGAMSSELNTYNNYYKNNGIVNYVVKERVAREKNKEFKLNSTLEKQLSELGVKTERIDIGLKIDGTTKIGMKIDEIMKNNLGRTFKTFDNFDKHSGTATSVKSINLDAKTYQSGSGLSSKIKSDIGATLDFDKYELGNKFLKAPNITKRIINIVVDDKPLNQSQIENFKKAVDFGNLNNVEVKVTINGGK